MRPLAFLPLALAAALLSLPGDAEAAGKRASSSLSIGAPNRGRLEGGKRLRSSKHLRVRKGARAYGLPKLLKTLKSVAYRVSRRHRGATLLVADLSAKSGGFLDGHRSHQSGRDADLGFYATNSRGKSVNATRFVAFNADGKAKDGGWMRFDDARNWTLVETILKDKRLGVHFMVIAPSLERRLIAYATKKKVPKELVHRAAALLIAPTRGEPHDDHFHLRIACPKSMRGKCHDESVPSAPKAPQVDDADDSDDADDAGDSGDSDDSDDEASS